MAYTQTTNLGLDKAVVGTNQAFETVKINDNWDKVDGAFDADTLAPRVQDVADEGIIISGGTA
jgi:hypothetical protein